MRSLLTALLTQIAPFLSDALRELLERAVREAVELAEGTKNEFDDILVNALVEALGIEPDETARKINEANGDTVSEGDN
jgi:hypothetical protein